MKAPAGWMLSGHIIPTTGISSSFRSTPGELLWHRQEESGGGGARQLEPFATASPAACLHHFYHQESSCHGFFTASSSASSLAWSSAQRSIASHPNDHHCLSWWIVIIIKAWPSKCAWCLQPLQHMPTFSIKSGGEIKLRQMGSQVDWRMMLVPLQKCPKSAVWSEDVAFYYWCEILPHLKEFPNYVDTWRSSLNIMRLACRRSTTHLVVSTVFSILWASCEAMALGRCAKNLFRVQ